MPGITHWQHPSFFGYVSNSFNLVISLLMPIFVYQFPVNATFAGILADLYAAGVSNPGFNVSVDSL